MQLDADGGALNFRPLSKDDLGQYTCVAINDAGEDRSEGKLNVIGELEVAQINYDGITVFVAFFLYQLCDIELSNSTSSDLNKQEKWSLHKSEDSFLYLQRKLTKCCLQQ